MTKSKFFKILLLLVFITSYGLRVTSYQSYAQDSNKLTALSKQITESKTNAELYVPFEELKDLYFQENKYTEFIEFLGSLAQKKETLAPFASYYAALSRYAQLKHLEETQSWDEYFNNGNTYRDELTQALKKTLDSAITSEPLNLYARLILWQFHKDQQDTFVDAALSDLMNNVLEYAKDTQNAKPIKDVADKLLAYGEKGKSKELYQIYVEKLLGAVKDDQELEDNALGFYQEGNLELSETLYDVYIERITRSLPKEKTIAILTDIARKFSYRDEGNKDAAYAEKIFARIEELGSKNALDEDLTYLRAFNSERIKEYSKAKDLYTDLLLRFPKTNRADEVNFKIGIISTYILRDIKTGRDYFEKLTQEGTSSPQAISSFYQLGLLSQWEGDTAKAKEYYHKLIEKAKDGFADSLTLTQERLKEIEEAKPLEYNLKTFLDTSLKAENKIFDMTKLDLKASLYRPKKDQGINISALVYVAETGCMHVEMQYLWSADLGTAKPTLEQQAFDTTYAQPGTRVIGLVVISPAGIVDRGIEMLDVD